MRNLPLLNFSSPVHAHAQVVEKAFYFLFLLYLALGMRLVEKAFSSGVMNSIPALAASFPLDVGVSVL